MRHVREKNNKSVYHINTITLYIIYIMVALIFEVKISYTLSKFFTIRLILMVHILILKALYPGSWEHKEWR